MMKLRPHQQRLKDEDPDHALLVHEMRTGKSLIGKNWVESPKRNKNPVVICLKQNKKEWVELCPTAIVYTKEEFKKHWRSIKAPSAILVDEAHNFAAPLYVPKKRSQMAEALFNFINKHKGVHVLLLTATPLTNDPASLHTLMTYIGKYADWKNYRQNYYELKHMPFLAYPTWFPKKDWRAKANLVLQKHADIVSLADCVDSLPPESFEIIKTKAGKYKYAEDEEHHWTKDHIAEQYNKLPEIKKIGDGYRKVILVCNYTAQIDELAKKLEKQKPVFVLDGRTKDAEAVKKEAQAADDCYFIVQAKMGMGWDGYMFGCMVFVSMAHRQIDYTQMLGRLTSVDHPKPKVYVILIGGTWDKRIYDTLRSGENFNPHKYEST